MGKPRFGQLFGVLSSESTGSQTMSGSLTVNGSVTAAEFSGSGAGLTGIPASGIIGLNLNQISSGSASASISPNNGLEVNTTVTATSFTGSLFGTSSLALSAVTASYAFTASYIDGGFY